MTNLPAQQAANAPSSTGMAAEQSRSVAEIQAAMTIAQHRPRNEATARDRLLKACTRASLAQTAVYTYPRGNQSVSGPSIRLAEVAARSWGNMNYGFREIGRRDGESEIEAFAWDLETNTKAVRHFVVKHWRDTRSGGYELKDTRDIYELVANQAQRRVRACILEIIPGDIIEDAVAECDNTMRASIGTDDIASVVKKLVEAFESKFGVTRKAIEAYVGHKIDSLQPAEIVRLRKIYASINDGFASADDWFDIGADKDAADLNAKVMGQEPATDQHDGTDAEDGEYIKATDTVTCPISGAVQPRAECEGCEEAGSCPELNDKAA